MTKLEKEIKEEQRFLIVPQEMKTDSMTIQKKPFFLLWRPNNYRRQITISRPYDSGMLKVPQETYPTIPSFPMELKEKYGKKLTIGGRNKLISIKDFKENITLQLGTTKLTAIYSQKKKGNKKIVFRIEGDNEKEVLKKIKGIKEDIKVYLDNALKEFSKQYGLYLPLIKPKWTRYEDFLRGEEYLEKIPKDVMIFGTTFKKVYERGIEFIKYKEEEPTDSIVNYIDNQAILKNKDVLTILANMNNKLDSLIDRFIPAIELNTKVNLQLSYNLKAHIKAVQQIGTGFKRFNNLLSQEKLSKWFK